MSRAGAVLIALSMAFVACGGDSSEPADSAAPSSTPEVEAEEQDSEGAAPDLTACLKAPKVKTQIDLTQVDVAFKPRKLEVPAGEKVTLIVSNKGSMEHTFTSDDLQCDSGHIAPSSKKAVTFKMPNKPVAFYCVPHSDVMSGKLVPKSG